MNRKKFLGVGIALLVGSTLSFGQGWIVTEGKQCNSLTKDSGQCKNTTKSKSELCYLHDKTYVKDDNMSQ